MKKLPVLVFLIFVFSAAAQGKELSGKEAAGYIGSIKERLSGNTYRMILLKRRDRDVRTFAELDGIVFFRSPDKYKYIRRQDDDHRLRLSSAGGERAPAADPRESAEYEALIKENKLYPHVITDKDGKELFLIYSAVQQSITWSRNKRGEIILEVRDLFKEDEPLFTFDPRTLENKN